MAQAISQKSVATRGLCRSDKLIGRMTACAGATTEVEGVGFALSEEDKRRKNISKAWMESRAWEPVQSFLDGVVRGEESLGDLMAWNSESEEWQPCPLLDHQRMAETICDSAIRVPGKRSKSTYRNYCMVVSYVGWAFGGFGIQPSGALTVQGAVESSISAVTGDRPIRLTPVGRTDKWVSASCQVLSFLTEKRLEQGEVAKTLWNSSSGSARVVRLERAPAAFHAQFSGEWRSYLYLLPLHMAEGAEFPEDTEEARELEAPVESIMSMIGGLEGCTLDMNAFARDTPKGKNTEVAMKKAKAARAKLPGREGEFLAVEMVANRFVRKLARVVVSSAIHEALMEGADERCPYRLHELAEVDDRRRTAIPAPGIGLCLTGAGYARRSPESALPS